VGFDESTIVWGLGLLCFFCVTGRFPSDGPKDKRLEEQIEASGEEWAGVPSKLAEVCGKMVAKAPQDRPKLKELKGVLAGLN
jgi:serine/threonine protein kinase